MRTPDLARPMIEYLSLREEFSDLWKPTEQDISIVEQGVFPEIKKQDAVHLKADRVRFFLKVFSLEVKPPRPEFLRAAVSGEALVRFKMIPYYTGEKGLPGLARAQDKYGFIIGHDFIYGYSMVAGALMSGLDTIAGKSQQEVIGITGQLDGLPLEIAELITQGSSRLAGNAALLELDHSGITAVRTRRDAILQSDSSIPSFLVDQFVFFGASLATEYYEHIYSFSDRLTRPAG